MWYHVLIAVIAAVAGATAGTLGMAACAMAGREEDRMRERELRLALIRLMRACECYDDDMVLQEAFRQGMEALVM